MGTSDKPLGTSATSFFKTIFTKSTESDPAEESPLSLDQTPQEIAVKLLSVEYDYWSGLSTMEQNRSQLLSKIELSSDDNERNELKVDLKKLDSEIEFFKASKNVCINHLTLAICPEFERLHIREEFGRNERD